MKNTKKVHTNTNQLRTIPVLLKVQLVIFRTVPNLSLETFLLEYHNNTNESRLFPYSNSKIVYEFARKNPS